MAILGHFTAVVSTERRSAMGEFDGKPEGQQGSSGCFVNVAGVDWIIYLVSQRSNLKWRNRTLQPFTQTT